MRCPCPHAHLQVWILDSQPGTVPLDEDAPTSVGKIIALINQVGWLGTQLGGWVLVICWLAAHLIIDFCGGLHALLPQSLAPNGTIAPISPLPHPTHTQVPTPLRSRRVLYEWLKPKGIPEPVAHWLGSCLVQRQESLAEGGGSFGPPSEVGASPGTPSGTQLVWSFNIQGAAALYHSYRCEHCGLHVRVARRQCATVFTPQSAGSLVCPTSSPRALPPTLCA